MSELHHVQNFFFAFFGTTCLFMAIFCLIIEQPTVHRKRAIFQIEMSAAILLISDLLASVYKGNPSDFAFWTVRIVNFLIYMSLYFALFGLNYYLRTFITKPDGSFPKRLKTADIISYIGMAMVVVSQFTGIFYSFEADNVYRRGSFFWLSYIAPLLIYVIILSVIIEYRKRFPVYILMALLFFAGLPLIGACVQGAVFGFNMLDLAIGIAAVATFIFSLFDQNMYLREISTHEKMTGLPNSYGLMAEIDKRIGMRTIAEYNAFYFDIVRMGLVNRKYGNKTGDEVIIEYTKILQSHMDDSEVLGRLGGNYFVALIRKENTWKFIELLRGVPIQVRSPLGEDEEITVSSIAGVYEIQGKDVGTVTPQQILSNISMAVNVAKNVSKKPYVFLTPNLIEKMNAQRQTLEMIPSGMAKKEFRPYYQPKVNTATNRLSGAEALVRWHHDGQTIAPVHFISLMEQNESICKFDFYMLNYVCSDIREWLDKGVQPPVISINFSRKNLGNPNLAEGIYNTVKKHGIPFDLIQIEITETVDEYPLEALKGVVEALQHYGMTAAIDDFGTGSSSIKILKDVPFNVLKIDKTFIDSTTDKDRMILGYIIAMAKSLKANVITEGVEHEEQIEILEELGCTEIQGYYFDKPLSKELFEERMRNPEYEYR